MPVRASRCSCRVNASTRANPARCERYPARMAAPAASGKPRETPTPPRIANYSLLGAPRALGDWTSSGYNNRSTALATQCTTLSSPDTKSRCSDIGLAGKSRAATACGPHPVSSRATVSSFTIKTRDAQAYRRLTLQPAAAAHKYQANRDTVFRPRQEKNGLGAAVAGRVGDQFFTPLRHIGELVAAQRQEYRSGDRAPSRLGTMLARPTVSS